MDQKVKMSIIMPSLNVVDYIDECIQSALHQTIKEKEILCIDAGSTDGTWEKLQDYAKNPEYAGIMKVIHSEKRSYGYQVNLGIRQAQGEYVAILETDDFIDLNMYQELYDCATAHHAEVVKADFDLFVTAPNKKRYYETVRLFRDDSCYDRMIDPRQNHYLYANDYNIWKGIYNRRFLMDNAIWLNESKGAAFQDIGFSQQILACTEKMYYSSKSFYRYRMDRAESSINSVHSLEYSYQEFRRLLETEELFRKLTCMNGLYIHMMQSFCGELTKTVAAVGYDMDSEYIRPYADWFKKRISEAMENHLIDIDLFQLYPVAKTFFQDEHAYIESVKRRNQEQEERKEKLLEQLSKEQQTVLFGVGIYGKCAIRLLYEENVDVVALTDNNSASWHTKKWDLEIIAPQECVVRFPEAQYLIANKLHAEEIVAQLMEMGVQREQCKIYQL